MTDDAAPEEGVVLAAAGAVEKLIRQQDITRGYSSFKLPTAVTAMIQRTFRLRRAQMFAR
jgi:hypothetical protein